MIYRSCKRFGEAFGSTVLIVHHAGKSEGAIMRGASALFDDSDFVYQMMRPCWQTRGMDAALNGMKLKNGRPIKNYELRAIEVPWSFEGKEGRRTGKDLVLTKLIHSWAIRTTPQEE